MPRSVCVPDCKTQSQKYVNRMLNKLNVFASSHYHRTGREQFLGSHAVSSLEPRDVFEYLHTLFPLILETRGGGGMSPFYRYGALRFERLDPRLCCPGPRSQKAVGWG